MAEVTADEGTSVPLDADHEERAIYVVDGEVEIINERYEGPRLLVFRPGDRITVKAVKPTRMMFLGGRRAGGPAPISGGILSLPVKSALTGQAGLEDRPALLPSPTSTSSFRFRSEPSHLPFPPRASGADDRLRKSDT